MKSNIFENDEHPYYKKTKESELYADLYSLFYMYVVYVVYLYMFFLLRTRNMFRLSNSWNIFCFCFEHPEHVARTLGSAGGRSAQRRHPFRQQAAAATAACRARYPRLR